MFRRFQKNRTAFGAAAPTGPVEFLVVGLGNPGRKYTYTRHNAGFLALDWIAKRYGAAMGKSQFQSSVGHAMIAGRRVLLQKPGCFMNLSGQAVKEATKFYKIPSEHIIVVTDDVALGIGRMRVRPSGSDGGHNGLKNILYLLGVDTVPRIRIGVGGKPHPDYQLADWVLGEFGDSELKTLDLLFPHVADAVECIIRGEVNEAMSRCNGVSVGDAQPKPGERA